MKRVSAVIPIERMPGLSPLYRDHVLGRAAAPGAALGGFRAAAPDWARAGARAARMDPRLVARLSAYNRSLGAGDALVERLRGLGDGSVRAIVTGQQPGVVGGPLMTLHKIATATALARRVEAERGVRCVPVFWMGADDDDFAEVRELACVSAELALVAASLPAGVTAPGRRVGDIGADAVRGVWNAVGPLLPVEAGGFAAIGSWLAPAQDLAEAAARAIVQLSGGEVAVVDGREPVLRECARDLLLAWFDGEEALRPLVRSAGERLAAAGYHAQLETGDSSGLFLVEGGVRQRIPAARRAQARARFVENIAAASPGVVARNLVQDALFDPLAVVLGPAEVAYRAQLADVYDSLGVPRPVVFPRMGATFVPPAVARFVAETGIDAELLALDPAAVPDAARARLQDETFGAAARAAEAEFTRLVERFGAMAAGRLDERAREKLARRFADLGQRLRQAVDAALVQDTRSAAARYPFLPHLGDVFARAGVAQERYLSMTVPYAFHGAAAWDGVRAVALEYTAAALDGTVAHRVYSV